MRSTIGFVLDAEFKKFEEDASFSEFVSAMLQGDDEAMNYYMNKIALQTFNYYDTGKEPSDFLEPEKFYHGFVLGLMVDKASEYIINSNRESGFGRYDVVMEPKNLFDRAVIIEFKVFNPTREATLSDTVENALVQIEEKHYDADLLAKGIPSEHILKYGFAFEGKKCLIKKSKI
ncbi:PD-(D/E)XK nuclease superfamily protein [Lachnospiraceae bacterium XBB1006]|nr:PD-(D/E)XK nuclease superfamily protein [Lachnospiraceae bacterium XBB1006]